MQKNISATDVQVERMDISHLDDVVAIENSIFHNPWTYDMYKAEVLKDYSHHYVLIKDGEVIGYFGFFNTQDDEAEVTNIAVKSDYQGMGLGNIIMNNMLEYASKLGINRIFLEVRDSNVKAINLYAKFDFQLINIRHKYYDGVEDARILMWKR